MTAKVMTYDEMTSRAGRPAMTPAAAFEILDATRAAEFDPVVVTALRAVLAGNVPVDASAGTPARAHP